MRRDATFLGIVLAMLLLLHVGASDLLIIILFPVLILAAVRNAGYAAGLLNGRPLSWLGAISYSLYLVHGFVQFVTTKMLAVAGFGSTTELSGLGSLALTAGMVSASLLLATITYYAVEKAGRRYLRSLLGVRSAARSQKSRSIEPHKAYR
jgi:peptidoglycan/LPS O-acetylase OafA/YrhL